MVAGSSTASTPALRGVPVAFPATATASTASGWPEAEGKIVKESNPTPKLRGGGYFYRARDVRSAAHIFVITSDADRRFRYVGFRLARDKKQREKK